MGSSIKNTIIISGGGTGGHIYPAIAIANAIKEMLPEINILFIGAKGKMEMEKVPEAGYEIIGLPIAGIQRSLSLKNLLFPFKLVISLIKACSIIISKKPQAVVGVGGYASGPILFAAQLFGRPTLIQEQNSFAGITNKLLSKRAKRICVAYPGMDKFFPEEKITLTGNPVRKDILNVDHKRSEAINHFGLEANKKTILAIGGSLGALSINESIAQRKEDFKDIQLIWQTGKHFYPKVKDFGKGNIKVNEFIKRMDYAYAAADVVISRAGALSISELCLVGKPTVFVPFPYAAEDHQTHNAKTLVNENAGFMISDKEARKQLIDKALELLSNSDKQIEFTKNIKALGKPDAAKEIAKQVIEISN